MGSAHGSLAEVTSPAERSGFGHSPEIRLTSPLFVVSKNKTDPEVFGEDSQLYQTGSQPDGRGGIAVACEGEISNIEEVAFSAGLKMPETELELIGKLLSSGAETDEGFDGAFQRLATQLKGTFALVASYKWSIYAVRDSHGEGSTLYTSKEGSPVMAASCDQADVIGAGVRETLELPPNTVLKMGAWAYDLYSLGSGIDEA